MQICILGCRLKTSYPLLAIVVCVILWDDSEHFVLGLCAAMLHEFGHLFEMVRQGDMPEEITFRLFDIVIKDARREQKRYENDIKILIAGPLWNFVMGVIFYFFSVLYSLPWCSLLAYENFVLGFFNLMPIDSLDGGQIFFILLCSKLDIIRARHILQIVSFFFLFPLAVLGFLLLLRSTYNFSLLAFSCYLIFVLLLKQEQFY